MELETSRIDAAVTVTVRGYLDADNGYRVYEAAAEAAQAGAEVVTTDLAGVEFIDSVGLGMLIRARDELANDFRARLILREPSAYVTRLLELTGLQDQFVTE